RLARLFLEDHETGDGRGLHYHREEWWEHDGRVYRRLGEKELRARITARIKEEFDRVNVAAVAAFKPTESRPEPPVATPVTRECVANTIGALAGMAVLPGLVDRPVWLTDDGENANPPLMSFTNGLLDVEALLAGKRDVLSQHSARWFSET